MISNEAFEKAITTSTESKSTEAVQAPTVPSTPEVVAPKSEQVEVPATKLEEKTEWDGDVNKLPPELQTWAKKAQSTLTKRAMADSELRQMGQQFQQFQSSEDWKAFQSWKQGKGNDQRQVAPAPIQSQQPGITQEEWESAQLDGTGQKFNSLVDKLVSQKINQAAQMYGQELQQLRSTQQVTQFQQVLSDFADMNPGVLELHESGIMKPFLEEEMKSGSHKSYESMVQAAYERASQVTEKLKAKALAASQGRVAEKKSAVVQTGTTAAEADVVYAEKGRTFDEALNQALQGKKVKVKAK